MRRLFITTVAALAVLVPAGSAAADGGGGSQLFIRSAVEHPDGTATFPLHRGTSQGRTVYYLLLDSSDVYAQARYALRKIGDALEEAGARMDQVVRTRMFVTDIGRWEEVARAHGEVFGEIRPAATMVEVQRLIGPDIMVEIEADAYVG